MKFISLDHPTRCLLYLPNVAESLLQRRDWLCPQCVTCAKCGAFVDDPENIEVFFEMLI